MRQKKSEFALPCLSFHPNLIALSQLMNSANVFYSFFLFFFSFLLQEHIRGKRSFRMDHIFFS